MSKLFEDFAEEEIDFDTDENDIEIALADLDVEREFYRYEE
jgi:hypothetical protein